MQLKHKIKKYRSCSVREAGQLLFVTEKTIYNWLAQGRLDAFKVGRSYRITLDSVEKLLEGGKNVSRS